MRNSRENYQAMQLGIGVRLLEYGFYKKSQREYIREDERYYDFVFFKMYGDEGFRDFSGTISKEFRDECEKFGVGESQYALLSPRRAHIWRSAVVGEIDDRVVASERRGVVSRVWSDLGKHFPRRRSSDERTVLDVHGWDASKDVELCASQSLSAWCTHVAQIFLGDRDLGFFAAAYAAKGWQRLGFLPLILSEARAGNRETAQRYFDSVYQTALREARNAAAVGFSETAEVNAKLRRLNVMAESLALRIPLPDCD